MYFDGGAGVLDILLSDFSICEPARIYDIHDHRYHYCQILHGGQAPANDYEI